MYGALSTLPHSSPRPAYVYPKILVVLSSSAWDECVLRTVLVHGQQELVEVVGLQQDVEPAARIQKGTRVLISLWDSLMFGRVLGYPPEH